MKRQNEFLAQFSLILHLQCNEKLTYIYPRKLPPVIIKRRIIGLAALIFFDLHI